MPRVHHKKAQKAADKATPESNDPDTHPYAVGSTLMVLWAPDKSSRLCTVIDRAEVLAEVLAEDNPPKPDEEEQWRYYVHYHDFNRRMDEWVGAVRVLEVPTVALATAERLKAERLVLEEAKKEEEGPALPKEEVEEMVELVASNMGSQRGDDSSDFASGSGALSFGRRRKKVKTTEEEEEDANANGSHHANAVTAVEDMEHDEHEGLDEASLREHEEVTKVKNIGTVELGRHTMETWYFSPYPKEYYPGGFAEILYVDEHTFGFFKHKDELLRWQRRPTAKQHPPGSEIYRHQNIAMYEVDGGEHTVYCQNLCYFAKLFLDHKTLYYDVDPFFFYVLCEIDEFGSHPVGYYSKEKYSEVGYNLACILSFPPLQRKGYGRFLISFSYELSRKEKKVGAPEKPLSDLGHISYRAYWASTLLRVIKNLSGDSLSIMDLTRATSIMADDVVATLQYLGLIRSVNGTYILWAAADVLDALIKKHPAKQPDVDPQYLHWTPFLTDVKRDKFSVRSKGDNNTNYHPNNAPLPGTGGAGNIGSSSSNNNISSNGASSSLTTGAY